MPDGTVDVRGVRLAYSDVGQGPLVIRAHGLTRNRDSDRALGIDWRPLVDAGFRVVSYDARGHGASSGTPEPSSYHWDCLADDLLAVINHFSPDEPVRAIGISMGTGTILTALTLAPERFSAVVLGAPPTAWESRAAQVALYEQLANAATRMSENEFVAMLQQAPGAPIFAAIPDRFHAPSVRYDLLPTVYRGAGSSDLPSKEVLASVTVPALILAWDTDPGHPVSTAQGLAQCLPISTLHISETADDLRSWGRRAAAFFK